MILPVYSGYNRNIPLEELRSGVIIVNPIAPVNSVRDAREANEKTVASCEGDRCEIASVRSIPSIAPHYRTVCSLLLALIAVSFFGRSAQATTLTTHCLQIPGTTTYAGDVCLQRSSYPPLVSPADPRTYGADPTGVKNSAPAFQSAVNKLHDVHVTCPSSAACTYKISDAATQFPVLITHNQNIQCDPNVTLYDPDHDAKYTGMVTFYQVTGGGIQGCNMKGANVGNNSGAGPLPLDDNQGNRLVLVETRPIF